MERLKHFEEYDFYSESENNEDFGEYLSDTDEAESGNEDSYGSDESSEQCSQKENHRPAFSPQADSVLDDLLNDVFLSPSNSDSSERSSETVLKDLRSSDRLPSKDEENEDFVTVDEYTEKATIDLAVDGIYDNMKEDEELVSMEDVPDFASKKNVYGTCFNVSNGMVIRPHRIDYSRKDNIWIKLSQATTYDSITPVSKLLANQEKITPYNYGEKLEFCCKFTDVITKSSEEVVKMETRDFQKIITNAFNCKRLAVILLGIDERNQVTGCHMPMREQDNLCLALDTTFQTEFVPKIENVLDAADIKFIPVNNSPISDSYLVIIRIKQLRNQKYELESDLHE